VDQERNISSVAESKVNKRIAGIGAIKKSEKCPGIVKTIIDKVQWAVDYLGKMNNPQQNSQGQQQGQGGSMCNIF